MTDTIRTRSAILTLLADNSAKAISAQDLRDTVISMWGVFGEMYIISGSSSQTITQTAGVLTLWNAAGESNGMTIDTSDNEIVIGTNGDGTYRVHVNISYVGDAGAKFVFQLRKNGSAINRRGQSRALLHMDMDESKMASFHGFVTAVATDSFQIYVETDKTSEDVKVIDAQFTMERIY